MEINRIIIGVLLMFLLPYVAQAQEIKTDSICGGIEIATEQADSLRDTVSDTEVSNECAMHEKRMSEVWKRRAKYRNISYGVQTLKSDRADMKSDMAFGLSIGRTYYLHKKPIAGIMKFGVDWSHFDVNFAKYPDFPTSESASASPDIELANLGIMQIEAGMGVGPSLTVNPVGQLKLCLYFHVTPSYSLMMQNHESYHHYATFFNAGFSVSYKIISIGIENRWCGATSYDGVAMRRLDNIYDENGNFHDPFENFGVKMKTNTLRFYIGFRF